MEGGCVGPPFRHSGCACRFTISTPFSHLAPTCRQRLHLWAAGVARATGYRDDIDQVCEAAFKGKLEYNEQRPHQALNGLTPERVLQNHRKQQSPLISGTNSGG